MQRLGRSTLRAEPREGDNQGRRLNVHTNDKKTYFRKKSYRFNKAYYYSTRWSVNGRSRCSGARTHTCALAVPLQYLKACGVLHPELKDRVRPAALALGPRHALLLAEERPGYIGEM